MTKRTIQTPYQRLLSEVEKFAFSVKYALRVKMWSYKDKKITPRQARKLLYQKRVHAKCESCQHGYDGTRGNGYQPCGCQGRQD